MKSALPFVIGGVHRVDVAPGDVAGADQHGRVGHVGGAFALCHLHRVGFHVVADISRRHGAIARLSERHRSGDEKGRECWLSGIS
jgi:hypothetical protein